MTEPKTSSMPRWVRKGLIPALIGAVLGYAASAATLSYIDCAAADGLSVSATTAAVVAALYAVTGLTIMLGTASPRLGARLLNVEDADELREQKKVLTLSGAAMLLWGGA